MEDDRSGNHYYILRVAFVFRAKHVPGSAEIRLGDLDTRRHIHVV